MSEYTNEPLEMNIDAVSGCADIFAGIIDIGIIYSPKEARRIIACVNALEGLSDDALIGGWCFRGIEAFAKGLEAQRDELSRELNGATMEKQRVTDRWHAAAKDAETAIEQRDALLVALRAAHHMLTRDYIDDAKMAIVEQCDAAIAKAEGQS